MKNTLTIYWMLNSISEKRSMFIGLLMGVIISQILLYTDLQIRSYLTIQSLLYCVYFYLLFQLLSYSFMIYARNGDVSICLKQMHKQKDIYVKGIIVNNILTMFVYFLMNVVVSCLLAFFYGFSVEILISTIWCCVFTCLYSTVLNLAQCNNKKITLWTLAFIFFMFYLFCSLNGYIIFDVPLHSNGFLSYIVEPISILVLLPLACIGFVVTYYFGLYCYRTRKENDHKNIRELHTKKA